MLRSTRTSLILASLIILTMSGAVAYLMHRAGPRQPALQIPKHSTPALVRGAQNPTKAKNPREEYAWTLNRRLRDKGRTCLIESTDPENYELVISWTTQNLDRQHLEELQVAEGFFTHLQRLNFKRLVMKIDGKQVWDKQL